MQDYRNLHVWRKAHALALNVRRATRKFPRTGYTDLKTQLTRAAESGATNIVEGCGAATQKEFGRFLDISIKSMFELQYQLQLGRDNDVLKYQEWNDLDRDAVDVRKMLCGLRKKVLAADPSVSVSYRKTENGNTVNSEHDHLP